MTEKQLFDEAELEKAVKAAEQIEKLIKQAEDAAALAANAEAKISALAPWKELDIPLDYEGSENAVFIMGVLPAAVELELIAAELAEQTPAAQLELIASDTEQHYITLFAHKEQYQTAVSVLRSKGFAAASFKGSGNTPAEEIELLTEQRRLSKKQAEEVRAKIAEFSPMRQSIAAAIDAYTQKALQDSLLSASARTEKTVLLTGWVPEDAQQPVAELLQQLGCGYELRDPEEGEEPPTAYRNNKFTEPFLAVTDMYGTAAYGSVIDPNPLMSFFYFVFFGFIMADAMYGLLMFFGCWFYLKKKRPAGTMQRMLKLFMYCGVSTFVAGVLTGGWFADLATAVSGGKVVIPALWFEPLADPMKMLIFSLGLGAVQIVIGMGLSAWRSIKQGQLMDAVLDVGSWYIVFIGIGLFALGVPVGGYLMGLGLLLLLLTGGRKNKGLGKITGGLGKIYNITGFLSDLLSYSRIMALGLSGAVVGQVVNKIATMATGIPGVILFIAVFVFGHIFNLAIGLLGAYVHTSRLQYIEFFGRFFEGGGRQFKPLENNTKYVEIIKED
ncbi:MAG: V-type ATP synthase subunit I [Oscillospiraceae bacterium]|nr:V-type ATP synthase subunit I [Oscillospiraceae bacterium]